MSNQQNESSTLRDREFDSLISEGLCRAQSSALASAVNIGPTATQENAEQERVHVARKALKASPFAHASDAIVNANEAFFAALRTGDFRSAAEARDKALDAFLRPYYSGRGAIDGKRLLVDLETTKGAPLTLSEISGFGRVIGIWAGNELAKEVQAEIEAATARNASPEELAEIADRALLDALNPATV